MTGIISKWSILSALSASIRTRKDSKAPVPYEDVEFDVFERAERLDTAEKLLTQEGSTDPQAIPTYDLLDKELLTELSNRLLERGRLKRGISYDEGEAQYLMESLEKKYLDFAEKAKRLEIRQIRQDLLESLDAAISKREREERGEFSGEEEGEWEGEGEEEAGEEQESTRETPVSAEPQKTSSDLICTDLPDDVQDLGKRLKVAENRVLQAAEMIRHLGAVKGITQKIKNLQPYSLESEGAEMRKKLWLLEKRIIRLERQHRASEQLEELRAFEERWDNPDEESSEEEKSSKHSRNEEYIPQEPTEKEGLIDLRNVIKQAREKMMQAHDAYHAFSTRLCQVREGIELDSLCYCATEMANMKTALNALTGGQFENGEEVEYVNSRRLRQCQRNFDRLCKKVKAIGSLPEIIEITKTYMADMAKNIELLKQKIESGDPLRVPIEDNRMILAKLESKMKAIERKGVIEIAMSNLLFDDEFERELIFMAIRESTELLNVTKMDQTDLEDALNEKVNRSSLNDKVFKDELLSRMDVFAYIIDENTCTFKQHEIFREERSKHFKQILNEKVHIKDLLKFQKFVNKHFKAVTKEIITIPGVPEPVQAAGTVKIIGQPKEKCVACCECEEIVRPKVVAMPGMTPFHAYELQNVFNKQAHMRNNFSKEIYASEFAKKTRRILVYREEKGFRSKAGSHRNCGGTHTTTTAAQRVTRNMPCIPCPIPDVCTCPDLEHLRHVWQVKEILHGIIDKNIEPHHFDHLQYAKSLMSQMAEESAYKADYAAIQDMLFNKVYRRLL